MAKQPYDDASLDAVLPQVPEVREIAADSAGFNSFPLPGTIARYWLHVEPVGVAYELRFGSETTGITVPANTPFALPYPIAASRFAQVKLASGTATVRCLVAWPDR